MSVAVWFRQDFRVSDNSALIKALNSREPVVALFILTPKIWQSYHWSNRKVKFLLAQLEQLSQQLQALNIPLKLLQLDSYKDCPKALEKFCQQYKVDKVFANRELLVNEIQRDKAVEIHLNKNQINFELCNDHYVLPAEKWLKKDDTPFKVFTPFKRQWLQQVTPFYSHADNQQLKPQEKISIESDSVPTELPGFELNEELMTWPAGEQAAQQRLQKFISEHVESYAIDRDLAAKPGTSQLSPYLSLGVLSVRQCLTTLCDYFKADEIQQIQQEGAQVWISELVWREFYAAVAFYFPQVVKAKAFKPKTEQLPWSYDKKLFAAWCKGQTGFPFVDAGMRQLNQTGWMHNRLRMVTAMFLTKTLFIDWRWGEQYFMQQLVDGDFIANNGGWQWVASTGTDAVPYFRIFNPITQGQRFDKEADFIRQFCPELASCTNKEIHCPSSKVRKYLGYPEPIVDYKKMRALVLESFKALG
jgi:deoxyribodipyrimidine photo-lyase